jgi:hypothetical protein
MVVRPPDWIVVEGTPYSIVQQHPLATGYHDRARKVSIQARAPVSVCLEQLNAVHEMSGR